MNAVLVDTGPIVAFLRHDDSQHEQCVATFKLLRPPLYTSWPVITETTWLLRDFPHFAPELIKLFKGGILKLLPTTETDLIWMADFIQHYARVGAELADASLALLAEREQTNQIFTLDRRDFSVYRMSGNRSFRILPE